jgi:hypothetical protein
VLRAPESRLSRVLAGRPDAMCQTGRTRRYDARVVAELLRGDLLAEAVLRGIVEGRILAPKAERRSCAPPPLSDAIPEL